MVAATTAAGYGYGRGYYGGGYGQGYYGGAGYYGGSLAAPYYYAPQPYSYAPRAYYAPHPSYAPSNGSRIAYCQARFRDLRRLFANLNGLRRSAALLLTPRLAIGSPAWGGFYDRCCSK